MADQAVDRTANLLRKIENRQARIGIIGLGYVGLPLALLFVDAGFSVTGFDIDNEKVQTLNQGRSYIARIPGNVIAEARSRGFSATTDTTQFASMDAIIICVPTPLDSHHEPDLSFIIGTAKSVAPWVRRDQLIILESTTYPGTTEEILIPLLNEGSRPECRAAFLASDDGFYVAFSPEREDPGNETIARRKIPKVVGGYGVAARELASALYRCIFDQVVQVSSPAAAEMTKLLENIYRCVNIALVNELKQLCMRMNIDLIEVIEAAKTKPFGFHPFYPGPGLGGHCIPIDPFYLSWKAKEFDFHTRFIELAGQINTGMPYFVVENIAEALNGHRKALSGARILILGLAYKRDVDDLRESPALAIIEILQKRGACVSYNDPYFPTVGQGRKYALNMSSTPLDRISEFDCVVIVTDHSQYDYSAIVAGAKLVIDTRNATRGIDSPKIVRS